MSKHVLYVESRTWVIGLNHMNAHHWHFCLRFQITYVVSRVLVSKYLMLQVSFIYLFYLFIYLFIFHFYLFIYLFIHLFIHLFILYFLPLSSMVSVV